MDGPQLFIHMDGASKGASKLRCFEFDTVGDLLSHWAGERSKVLPWRKTIQGSFGLTLYLGVYVKFFPIGDLSLLLTNFCVTYCKTNIEPVLLSHSSQDKLNFFLPKHIQGGSSSTSSSRPK